MEVREYCKRRVEDFLKGGLSIKESAIMMVSVRMLAEVDMRGYDRVYLAGWLGGFNLEERIEKFGGVESYERGRLEGEKFREEVGRRYVN
jgi:hypothetical protein